MKMYIRVTFFLKSGNKHYIDAELVNQSPSHEDFDAYVNTIRKSFSHGMVNSKYIVDLECVVIPDMSNVEMIDFRAIQKGV